MTVIVMSKSRKPRAATRAKLHSRSVASRVLAVVASAVLTGQIFHQPKNAQHESAARISVMNKFDEWMQHYKPQGIEVGELEERSKTLRDLIARVRAEPEHAQDLIANPFLSFLKGDRRYQDYDLPNVALFAFADAQEAAVASFYRTHASALSGRERVLQFAQQHSEELSRMQDQDLALWALNAGLYAAKNSFRTSSLAPSYDEQGVVDSFKKGYGNCIITSIITHRTYLDLVHILSRDTLCSKVGIIKGFKDRSSSDAGHVWLQFSYEGREDIIETLDKEYDSLFETEYHPWKINTYGIAPESEGYVPLASKRVLSENGRLHVEKRIHILPRSLEKELRE